MEADVAFLAGLDRRATRAGERRAAGWIAGRLRELGAADVQVHRVRTQSSWVPAHAVHLAAGLAAAALGGPAGRVLAAAAALSYEADVGGRSQWTRRLLPAGEGTTVEARVPAAGPAQRTLVLAGHHDAAHCGWVWHPRVVAASQRRSARTGKGAPSHLVPLLALAGVAAGPRRVRAAAAAALGLALGLSLQSYRSVTAPGANDNATGVAGVLELARRLVAQPLRHVDVVLLFPSGEETGTSGSRAWLREHGRALDPRMTLMIALDSLGSGGEVVLPRREGLSGTYRDEDLALAEEAARRAGLEPPPRVAFPNVTDAMAGRRAGLRAFSVLTYRDGWIKNLHRPADTPAAVEWSTVEPALALVAAAAALWDDAAAA